MLTPSQRLFPGLGGGWWTRRLRAKPPTQPQPSPLGDLPAPEHTLFLIRRLEALRARGWPPFSVVVVDVGLPAGTPERANRLVEAFRRRARASDEAGWLARDRIALILPLTSRDGARRLAEEVCRRMDTVSTPPSFLVYTA